MTASLSDIVAQNTAGNSAGNPVGVPSSYSWYDGLDKVSDAPPSDFTAVTGWGQVYQKAGAPAYSNPNASVEIANATTYVHLKSTGQWVVAQDQATDPISGAHFVADFSGNAAIPMNMSPGSNGSTAIDTPPAGYNDHFWPDARGTYAAGDVDGVYVQMDMRVTDPNLQLIANVGADWWRDSSAGYVDGFSNNPAAGMSNWVQLSTQWSTLGFYSSSTAQFEGNLPPSLVGSAPGDTPPPVVTPPPVDTPLPIVTPPAATPTITSFTDNGIVGDGITNAASLKLVGTATAGSTVTVFDGATKLGKATADANGAWSFTTKHLKDATHSFTAKETDASGQTSEASSVFKVTVDTVAPAKPKITSFSPDTGTVGDGITSANHLTLVGTAEAGSTVKMFDGKTEIGTAKVSASGAWSFQTAQLSDGTHNFSARDTDTAGNTSSASSHLRVKVEPASPPPVSGGSSGGAPVAANNWDGFSSIPGCTALTGGTIDLWNHLNKVKATDVKATDGMNFGQQGLPSTPDGSGNAQPNGMNAQPHGVNETDRAMGLVTQFSAASVANPGAGVGGVLHQADTSATLAQTLAQSQHRV
jgi:hypothetical protein